MIETSLFNKEIKPDKILRKYFYQAILQKNVAAINDYLCVDRTISNPQIQIIKLSKKIANEKDFEIKYFFLEKNKYYRNLVILSYISTNNASIVLNFFENNSENPDIIKDVIDAYTEYGYFEGILKIFEKYSANEKVFQAFISALANAEYGAKQAKPNQLVSNELIAFLYCLESQKLRDNIILEIAKYHTPSHGLENNEKRYDYLHNIISAQIAKITTFFENRSCAYKQVLSFLNFKNSIELTIWFFEGIQLVKNGIIPLNIYMFISSYVIEFPMSATRKLYCQHQKFMSKKLFDFNIRESDEKYSSSKISQEEYLDARQQTTIKYQQRLTR